MVLSRLCYYLFCSERDDFEHELDDIQKQHTYLNVTFKAVVEERDQLVKEVK